MTLLERQGIRISKPLDRVSKINVENCLHVIQYALQNLDEPCPQFSGTGIVIAAGGKYLKYAYATVRIIRSFTDLPVQIWHIGADELPSNDKFRELDVEWVDAKLHFIKDNWKNRTGWAAKWIAVQRSPFQHVLLLDADSSPAFNPDEMFSSREYLEHGCIMWPDVQVNRSDMVYPCFGIPKGFPPEIEAGQVFLDKTAHWNSLRFAAWLNSHSFFHRIVWGDKDLLSLAMAKLGERFTLGPKALPDQTGITHFWPDGRVAFNHVMHPKRADVPIPEPHATLWKEYTHD